MQLKTYVVLNIYMISWYFFHVFDLETNYTTEFGYQKLGIAEH